MIILVIQNESGTYYSFRCIPS